MSTSIYAKFYTFSEDKKYLKSKPKDVWCNFMKNCYSLNDWDEELTNFDFSLPEEVLGRLKDFGFAVKAEHENDTIKHKLFDPNVDNIGFISPEADIEHSKYYINSDDKYVLVNELFDTHEYDDKAWFSKCIHENDLDKGWRVLKRQCYQYNGIWLDESTVGTAITSFEKKLEESYKKLFELKNIEKDVLYNTNTNLINKIDELKDLILKISKNGEDITSHYENSENESAIDRYNSDLIYEEDKIEELKGRVVACSELLGMFELFNSNKINYNDVVYCWLYLC